MASKSKKSFRGLSVKAALKISIITLGVIAIVTTVAVIMHTSSIRASRAEYDQLRELVGDIQAELGEFGTVQHRALCEEMRQINPDFVGWIRIEGTDIDYPVVRGRDNEKYINTSFSGEENIAGAIFMDYRNIGDLLEHTMSSPSLPHIIIYGHNLQQGGMFTDLRKLLNAQFMEENNIITLEIDGETVEFEIFSARRTDINDPAFFLNFRYSHSFPRFANRIGAPLRATQILTLATCVSDARDDARIVVQASRIFD